MSYPGGCQLAVWPASDQPISQAVVSLDMADAMRDQVVRTWSVGTDHFATRGIIQRTPDAIAAANLQEPDYSLGRPGVAGPNFLSSTATDRTLSAVSPIQGLDGQLGGGTIWAGRPHGGGSMQAGNVLGLPEVTQVRVTSPTFGTTPPSYATSVGDKPTHGGIQLQLPPTWAGVQWYVSGAGR